MIVLRKSSDRGHHREDWLSSFHTFSFHTYYDPIHMGFRNLRVINEDRVAADRGFGMHPHQEMEIISFVFEGALEHRDNLGNREIIGPYELQRITAGTGIVHSEMNPSPKKEVHFLQIWVLPARERLDPGDEIKYFPERPLNQLTTLTSPDGRENSAIINQDVILYYGLLDHQNEINYTLGRGRYGWLQVVRGSIVSNGQKLNIGDGAAISNVEKLELIGEEKAEFLLFDLN
jgi:redox-sensitive bicupin YhaK (pirin superfamily)